MPSDPRSFHLGDILSVTTGRLVSTRHMDGLYDLLGFMAGESMFTHQLPRVADECEPELLRQHPDLADVDVPDRFTGREHVEAWLAAQVARFGEYRKVTPLMPENHTAIDPLAELAMNHPHLRVINVEMPDGR